MNEEIIKIEILSYTVAFYGGKGFQDKIRTIISLYDNQTKLAASVRFYNDDEKPEKDFIDENSLFIMNVPNSSYLDIIHSLRSNRAINLIYCLEVVMLCEFDEPRGIPIQNIDTSKIN